MKNLLKLLLTVFVIGLVLQNSASAQQLQAPTITSPANNATFNAGTGIVSYSWTKNNANGFATYALKIVETNGLNGSTISVLYENNVGDVSSFTPTSIAYGAGKFYRFVVYAQRGSTRAEASARVFSINSPTPPTAPSNLVGSSSSTLGVRNTNLTWRDNSNNETGFEIERSTSSTSGFSRIATVSANSTSYNDLDIRFTSTFIYYRVRAIANTLSSGYSNTVGVQGNTTPPNVTSYSVTPKKGVVASDGFTWQVSVSNVTSNTQVFLEFCAPSNTTCNPISHSEQLTLVGSITNGTGTYRIQNRTLGNLGLYKTRFRIVHNGVTYYNNNGSWVNDLQVETTPHWDMEFLTQVYYRNWSTACMPTSAAMVANYLFAKTFVNTGRTVTVGTEANIPVWRESEVITTPTYKWNGQRLYSKGINGGNNINTGLQTYLRDYPKNGFSQFLVNGCNEGFGPLRNERYTTKDWTSHRICNNTGGTALSTNTTAYTGGFRLEMLAFFDRVGIRYESVNLNENALLAAVEKGPIILSRDGHIFVIIGKDASNNFICHDPFSDLNIQISAMHNGKEKAIYSWTRLTRRLNGDTAPLGHATLIPISRNAVAIDRHCEFSPYHLYCDTDLEHTQLVGSNGTAINVNYDGDGIHNFNDNAFTYSGDATGFRYNLSLYRNGGGYLQMNSVNGAATHSATYEMQVRRNGNYRVQVGYVAANTNSNAVAYRVEILNSNRTPAPYAIVNTTVNQQNGTGFQFANLMTSSLNLNTGHIIRITVTNAGNATNNGRNINIDMVRALYSGGTVSNGRVEMSEEVISLNEQTFSDTDLMLYPNPANGNEVYFTSPVSFTLLNIQGQVIQTYEEPQSSLDISQLKNGLYIIRTNEGKSMKLVIEK